MKQELILTFSYFGIGGAQRRAFSLAKSFAEAGYKVFVLAVLGCDYSIENKTFYDINENVELIIIPEYFEKHKNDKVVIAINNKINNKIFFLKIFQKFLNLIDKQLATKLSFYIANTRRLACLRSFMVLHKGATVINFGFNIFDRVWFSIKGLRMKIIYAETNALNKYKSERFFKQIKKCLKKVDAFVFQTDVEREELSVTQSYYVINNPVKPGLPQPYVGTRDKKIVNFCRLSRQKNLLLLIQAFEKLLKFFPDYKLEIFADLCTPQSQEYKNELMLYISDRHLENSILFCPPSKDVHNKILKSTMFVSSSDYEGISNSMVEAMAIGLPCVCTDCDGGGAREMIIDGENGLLVPPKDVDALKNAMIRLISEKGLAEKLSENAAKIRETHSVEKIAKKWLDVINDI